MDDGEDNTIDEYKKNQSHQLHMDYIKFVRDAHITK